MLTRLRLRNFKSWKDTGDIALRPITAFFGANSSGKTSLLQALLLLKQTSESSDRGRVFHFGNRQTLVDLGDFGTVVHRHDSGTAIEVELDWKTTKRLPVSDSEGKRIEQTDTLGFFVSTDRNGEQQSVSVEQMGYRLGEARFGMRRTGKGHELSADGVSFDFMPRRGRPSRLPPVRCYGFPTEVVTQHQNAGFLADLEHEFVQQLGRIHYLGPLRAYPERRYDWTGARPGDMGRAGESAVDAILAARARGDRISLGKGHKRRTLEEHVAFWLRKLGLIQDFRVEPLAEGLQVFQVMVRRTAEAARVSITDVGFGVSQVLPVLVLCFYAPEGSTIILEQPEIHLHPAIQSGLADVLIDAHRHRRVQILIESHSEHLLRRLQLRIADETLSSDQVGLWFCRSSRNKSAIEALTLDPYGSITNWPEDFFGDQFGEVAELAKLRVRRRAETCDDRS